MIPSRYRQLDPACYGDKQDRCFHKKAFLRCKLALDKKAELLRFESNAECLSLNRLAGAGTDRVWLETAMPPIRKGGADEKSVLPPRKWRYIYA